MYGSAIGAADPFEHYMQEGWRVGLNPNPYFDTEHYLASNPDVASAGVIPLLHYALTGAAERRSCVRRGRQSLRNLVLASQPPSERAKHFCGASDHRDPIEAVELEALLRRAHEEAPAGLIVSVSHDRYRVITGGVQSLIGDEEVAFRCKDVTYLHLAPAAPLPLLAPAGPAAFTLTLNGRDAGVIGVPALLQVLQQSDGQWPFRRLIVHHLMGHAPETLVAVAAATGPDRPIVWTHEFFTLCPSYALLRNDVAFCGAPAPQSGACTVCAYGADRKSHLHRMYEFFKTLEPDVVAPSASALDFWRSHCRYPHTSAKVVPLAQLELGDKRPAPVMRRGDGVLRVAFIGQPVLLKGWHAFEAVAHQYFGDPRYQFFAFGAWSGGARGVHHVPVQVRPETRDAMVEALESHGIDVVVSWNLCHETFSYATTEALAAGCFLIVRRASGNVWPQVRALGPRHGVALDSELELQALFASGQVVGLALQDRAGGRILRGSGSADLLMSTVSA
jgi:hypothetical protein